VRDAWNDTVDYVRDRIPDLLEPVIEFVEEVVGAWLWVLEKVAIVYPVIFERWETAADERVCPECGPIYGAIWEEGSGPHPPVHVNCRCRRVLAWTEWRTRYVEDWRLRWTTWTEWETRITGWA
ncbi:MAG TPA: hypothetical protein VFQ54_09170, partial [Thermomicrobiales bacterium]|nr:hypothetical protein [Thermomicrobiales bacterium]